MLKFSPPNNRNGFRVKYPDFYFFIFISSFSFIAVDAHSSTPIVNVEAAESWIESTDTDLSNEDSIHGGVNYLHLEHQVDLRGGTKKQYIKYSYQITSEQGLTDVSEVEIDFASNYETLIVNDIKRVRKNKSTSLLSPSDIKVIQKESELNSNIYNEKWTALIILEDVRVGDIVEVSYTIKGSNPVFGKKHFGAATLNYSVPVKSIYFRLLNDKARDIHFKFHNASAELERKEFENYEQFSFKQSNIKAVIEEDDTPSWHNPYAYLSYSQFESWKDVNQWALDLYNLQLELPKQLEEKIEQLTSKKKDISAARISQWIQDNIRYFGVEWGMNSHMPSSPKETFSRRYGDCKDKAVLLVAALQSVGIEAYPALVSSTITETLPEQLPSPGAFDHVIVAIDIDGQRYWVDATSSQQRGSLQQMAFPDFAWALIIDEPTKGLSQIEPITKKQRFGSINVKQTFNLEKTNSSEQVIQIETSYNGWQAEKMRRIYLDIGLEKLSKHHLDYVSKYYPQATSQQPLIVVDNEQDNIFTITEVYVASKLTDDVKNSVRFTTVGSEILDTLWLPNVRQRNSPFTLPYFVSIDIDTRIILDSAKSLKWTDEENYSLNDNEWFSYEREVTRNEKDIQVKHRYISNQIHIEPNELDDYIELLDIMEVALSHRTLLTSGSPLITNDARAKSLVKQLLRKNK